MAMSVDALTVTGAFQASQFVWPSTYSGTGCPRAQLVQEDLAIHDIPLESCRNAENPPVPLTIAVGTLCGLRRAAFGTNGLAIITIDQKSNGVVTYSYFTFSKRLPPEYVAGETVQVAIAAGCDTTVADTSATVDLEAHLRHATAGTVGSDLCTTAAQDIRSTTLAAKTFTINPAGLTAGDCLECRVTFAIRDNATITAVYGIVTNLTLLCDRKG
jgi:hypothetical protein